MSAEVCPAVDYCGFMTQVYERSLEKRIAEIRADEGLSPELREAEIVDFLHSGILFHRELLFYAKGDAEPCKGCVFEVVRHVQDPLN